MIFQGNARFFVPTFGGGWGEREDGARPRLCTPAARRGAAEPPRAPSPPRCGRWSPLSPAPGAPGPAPTPLRAGSAAAPSGLSGVPLVAGFPPKWWRRGGQGWMPPSGGTVPRAGARQHGALRPLPARPLPAGGISAPRTGAGPAAPRMRLGSGGPHPARVGGCPSAMPLPASPRSAPGAPDPRNPTRAPHSPGATPRSPAAAPSPRRRRGCPSRRVPAGAHLQGCSQRVPRAVSARPPSPGTFKNFEFGIQNRAGQSGAGGPADAANGESRQEAGANPGRGGRGRPRSRFPSLAGEERAEWRGGGARAPRAGPRASPARPRLPPGTRRHPARTGAATATATGPAPLTERPAAG